MNDHISEAREPLLANALAIVNLELGSPLSTKREREKERRSTKALVRMNRSLLRLQADRLVRQLIFAKDGDQSDTSVAVELSAYRDKLWREYRGDIRDGGSRKFSADRHVRQMLLQIAQKEESKSPFRRRFERIPPVLMLINIKNWMVAYYNLPGNMNEWRE